MTQIAPNLDDLYALSVMLEPGERITLARWLLESVDPEQQPANQDMLDAHRAKMLQRLEDVRAGRVELLDEDEAMRIMLDDSDAE